MAAKDHRHLAIPADNRPPRYSNPNSAMASPAIGRNRRGLSPVPYLFAICLILTGALAGNAAAGPPLSCTKIVLTGQVSAGQLWSQAFGQGWVFQVLPIQPGKDGYTGWDLVVDRDPPAGFPDALLLATPPYDSINEREIGTTYGLRAQDAIGWNPRSFRFLIDRAALDRGQRLFQILHDKAMDAPAMNSRRSAALQRLLTINQKSSAGQFQILNAQLAPGVADAAPFAERWAIQSPRTPHTVVPSSRGKASPQGELDWMQFSITLWLSPAWKTPKGVTAVRARCP